MKTVCWIVSEPGAGKTTLARLIMGEVVSLVEKPKWTIGAKAIAAGHYTGKDFDGADTISYTGGLEAVEYWYYNLAQNHELTLFDGDRLSNKSILQRMASYQAQLGNLRLCCILLELQPAVAKARREARSKQDATWAKGRKTKAANFAYQFGDARVVFLSGTETPQNVYDLVLPFLELPSVNQWVPLTGPRQGSLL